MSCYRYSGARELRQTSTPAQAPLESLKIPLHCDKEGLGIPVLIAAGIATHLDIPVLLANCEDAGHRIEHRVAQVCQGCCLPMVQSYLQIPV